MWIWLLIQLSSGAAVNLPSFVQVARVTSTGPRASGLVSSGPTITGLESA